MNKIFVFKIFIKTKNRNVKIILYKSYNSEILHTIIAFYCFTNALIISILRNFSSLKK